MAFTHLHVQLVVSEWFSEAVDGVSAVVLLMPATAIPG